MLKRGALFVCLAATCMGGDLDREVHRTIERDKSHHETLAAQPTPQEWRAGAVWRFVTTPPSGKPDPEILTLRVTDKPGVSCLADGNWKNIWRRFVVLEGNVSFGPPVYQVEGRALKINLSGGVCDVYDIIDGDITGSNFTGRRTTFGLGARAQLVGTVRGSYVQQ